MEKLNVQQLLHDAVAEGRRELAQAQTTTEKHEARRVLQKALRAVTR